MDRVPSVFGIGQHPSDVLSSISLVGADWSSSLTFNGVSEFRSGALLWALPVTALTIYINGSSVEIPIGMSIANPNNVNPMGILDTGVPFVFARRPIVNAFFGAYGIGPGTDGSCWFPQSYMLASGACSFKCGYVDRLCALYHSYQYVDISWLSNVSSPSTRCDVRLANRSRSVILC
jgi:hypothetical protein